jgi:hypothetical protein
MSDSQISKAFFQGTAYPERIAAALVEVLRDLMRATAAKHDPTMAVVRATENREYLLELLKRCNEPVSWRRLFEDAIQMLRPKEVEFDRIEWAIQEIAREGMSYYVEGDRSLASEKEGQLMHAIEYLELRRQRGTRNV